MFVDRAVPDKDDFFDCNHIKFIEVPYKLNRLLVEFNMFVMDE
jgi:hypothetical protein